MSTSGENLAKSLIPLKEIHFATQNFSSKMLIREGQAGKVYKGQLSEGGQIVAFKRLNQSTSYQEKHEFRIEVEMMSSLNHENIIGFLGYCDEDNEMIIVFEYTNNYSLHQHLEGPEGPDLCSLTWTQRLKICLGAARGLEYLHSGIGEGQLVIHRNIRSAKILLDDNLEAKIYGFGLSILVDRNQPQVHVPVAGMNFYVDPIYKASGMVNTEGDVYSFGVVLFEMMSGMLVYHYRMIDANQPQPLINLVRRYSDDRLEKIIDHNIRSQMNVRSFRVFMKIACKCISWRLEDRPGMKTIIGRIRKALDIQSHDHGEASTISIPSHQHHNLTSSLIPLEEIKLANRDFSHETCIGSGGSSMVYGGQLSKRWRKRIVAFKRINACPPGHQSEYQHQHQFNNELRMMSRFNHENIISFLGYCDEGNEMIIVSEYAINGSLDHHLRDESMRRSLTWVQRLKICIGIARGLDYLHSSLEEDKIVVHRDIKSANILLDVNMEAKICDFALSVLMERNQQKVYDYLAGTQYYLDPIHEESGIVNKQLDVYSFGVVMLEILSGTMSSYLRTIGDHDLPRRLVHFVRHYYNEGVNILIDPLIEDEANIYSVHMFMKIVYRCISLNLKDRPTMKTIVKRIEAALDIQIGGATSTVTTRSLESYLIPLEEINSATRDFNLENQIGKGGFGVVYKGQLSERWKNCTVAIKRLDHKGHKVQTGFHTELKLIYSFHHQNIISFVGYCDEGDQMIIVSRYAINGSLDNYLQDEKKRRLTWSQRLKICLGAAKGLDYLHSGLGNGHTVIHRDFKSGNILLDENMEAKICDFGMSKEDLNNRTKIYTKVVGTNFYMDPIYHGSGILRKESDVYSFGVVLFEMLSGRLAYRPNFVDGKAQPLLIQVRQYYDNEPEKLIDPFIRDQIDSRCFHVFKEIAYQCISFKAEERPTMDIIIDTIEDAIDFQVSFI